MSCSRWWGRIGAARRPRDGARIDEDNDQVRIEVETALKKGIPVIPVLVGRGEIPSPAQLPDSLKQFSYRNAVRVDTGQDFDHHVDRLIRETDSILKGKGSGARPFALAGIAAALLVALALGGFAIWRLSQDSFAHAPWLTVANGEMGEEEIAGPENNPRILDYIATVQSTRGMQDDEIDWASAFAEWSLNQVGIEGPQSMDPNAWLTWGRGIDAPRGRLHRRVLVPGPRPCRILRQRGGQVREHSRRQPKRRGQGLPLRQEGRQSVPLAGAGHGLPPPSPSSLRPMSALDAVAARN